MSEGERALAWLVEKCNRYEDALREIAYGVQWNNPAGKQLAREALMWASQGQVEQQDQAPPASTDSA